MVKRSRSGPDTIGHAFGQEGASTAVEYAWLAKRFRRLEETTKRLEITAILAEVLDATANDQVEPVARLLRGQVAPDWEGLELGLAEKMILRTLAGASGIKDMTTVYHEAGDLGLAAEKAMEGCSRRQATLFGPEPLHVKDVFDRLVAIARTSGSGSQERKQQLLQRLLTDASPLEARYIIRTVAGRLRLGVADMTFLDALTAHHLGKGVRSVQDMSEEERAEHEDMRGRLERAYDVTSDLARVAGVLRRDGPVGVDALDVTLGVPLRPMAAERLKTLGEILEKHGGRSSMEYKYDGLRVQAHVPADPDEPVRLFSRRMEELTDQFPDVQQHLRAAAKTADLIVEGEVVAIRPDGTMLPFQAVSRRRGRKTGLGEDARIETALSEGGATSSTIMDDVPVGVFLFDLLASDASSRMDEAYQERRARLEKAFHFDDHIILSTMHEGTDEAGMEMFFQRAVQEGAEGIMCKAPTAPYKAGNRGFDWVKFKTDYTEELVDTMDLVVIGAFHGRGRRGGWYGALLMACYDPDEGRFRSVCKLGTGFDDETLKGLKERFEGDVVPARPPDVDSTMEPDVWISPSTVMEVQAAELTLSPIHRAAWGRLKEGAGLAARFPRFSGRWRDDKDPELATTVEELVALYEAQGKVAAGKPGKAD